MSHKNKHSNPYKEANDAFLAEKAKEGGIIVLDNGVMYRVLEEGHGTKKPTPRSIVYAHYTGKLIDGTVFDTTEGSSSRHCSWWATSSWGGKSLLHVCTKVTSGRSTSLPSGAMEP